MAGTDRDVRNGVHLFDVTTGFGGKDYLSLPDSPSVLGGSELRDDGPLFTSPIRYSPYGPYPGKEALANPLGV